MAVAYVGAFMGQMIQPVDTGIFYGDVYNRKYLHIQRVRSVYVWGWPWLRISKTHSFSLVLA